MSTKRIIKGSSGTEYVYYHRTRGAQSGFRRYHGWFRRNRNIGVFIQVFPNSVFGSNNMEVYTAFQRIRSKYVLGIHEVIRTPGTEGDLSKGETWVITEGFLCTLTTLHAKNLVMGSTTCRGETRHTIVKKGENLTNILYQFGNMMKCLVKAKIIYKSFTNDYVVVTKKNFSGYEGLELKISPTIHMMLADNYDSPIRFSLKNSIPSDIQYLPPELVSTKFRTYNRKVDIWSLGCLIYDLTVSGKSTFYGNPLKVAMGIVYLKSLEFPENVDPDLKHLLSRMIEKDVKKRMGFGEFFRHRLIQVFKATTKEDPDLAERVLYVYGTFENNPCSFGLVFGDGYNTIIRGAKCLLLL